MPLDIKIAKEKNFVYTVSLSGSLDTETVPRLEEELREIVDERTKAVLFDMTGISYISSSGIGIVMTTKKTLKENNATFAMVNLRPPIKKVFDAMKVLPMISIFDDMPEADKYIDQIIREEAGKEAV